MFTRTELRCLKVLFTIMDRDDSQQINKEELIAYAEETGDFAQKRELNTVLFATRISPSSRSPRTIGHISTHHRSHLPTTLPSPRHLHQDHGSPRRRR
mmetsp:Transcript_100460/g.287629  ORF Transcript_100460/g.287629 Transcript_100460/m.287629 type:complete len:98 (+) Transcript_100460:4349-4642(+)